MKNDNEIVAYVSVGLTARDAKAFGRYRFASMPRIGEEILVDLEQGDGAKGGVALKVTSVSHFPVSLEAPMGPVPTSDPEYVMILCSEI